MMQRMAFVFDIDDTLYLERDYARSGFHAVGEWARERFACESFADRCWSLFEANVRGSIFNEVLRSLGLPDDTATIAEAVGCYREHLPGIRLLKDAETLLTRLHRNYSTAIAFISDGPLIAQSQKAAALGLSKFSETVLLTDRWGREFWKPHPRAFEAVEQRFSLPPDRCVYIADNPTKDFRSPQLRGWQTVRIRRKGGLHAHLESAVGERPDIEVDSLDELTMGELLRGSFINKLRAAGA